MSVTMIRVLVAMTAMLSMCEGGILRRQLGKKSFITPPIGCYYDGSYYPPGPVSYGFSEANNHCYGAYCDINGNIFPWNDWNCFPTPTPPVPTTTTTPALTTTPAPTTMPPTEIPGCYYQDRWYPLDTMITKGEDRANNWCWVVFCSDSGHVMSGDDFDCFPTTTTTSTPPPPTMPGRAVG